MRIRHALLTGLVIALAMPGLAAAPAVAQDPRPSGTVVGWGSNFHGEASPLAGLTGVVQVDAGWMHSLALKSDGSVVGWGYNYYGQASPPVGLVDVVQVAAGSGFSLALKSGGSVVGWGDDSSGQASPPVGLVDVVQVAAGGHHSLALKSDGSVVGWGDDSSGQASPPVGLVDVVQVAAGGTHSLALKSDGSVVGWGLNNYGVASSPVGLVDVVQVDAETFHSLALKSDGTVVGWGYNGWGQASPPVGLVDVVEIGAATTSSLALKSDGTLVAWGDDTYGQTSPPAGTTGVMQIAAGNYHSLALLSAADPVDSTPPVVTWVFPDPPASGWYTQYPTAVVTATDPSGITSITCQPGDYVTRVDGLGTTTATSSVTFAQSASAPGASFACSAMDGAGNHGAAPGSSEASRLKVDVAAPTVTLTLPDPLSYTAQPTNGWYSVAPVVGWVSASSVSPIMDIACDGAVMTSDIIPGAYYLIGRSLEVSAEGETPVTCTASNQAGHSGAAAGSTNTATVRLSTVVPTVSVTGAADGAVYPVGGVPAGGCAVAGVAPLATQTSYAVTGGTVDGFGTYTGTCSGAVDVLGRAVPSASATYTVTYAFLGFARPLPGQTFSKRSTSNVTAGFQMGTYTGTRTGTGSLTKAVLSTDPNGAGSLTEGSCRYANGTKRWECRVSVPASVQPDGRDYYITVLQQIGTAWHVMPNGSSVVNPNSQVVRFSR